MGNKSFLVYYDLEEQTESLTDEQMGKLFRAMMALASRAEAIDINASQVEMALKFVRVQLREDKIRYERKCQLNRENASKRKS